MFEEQTLLASMLRLQNVEIFTEMFKRLNLAVASDIQYFFLDVPGMERQLRFAINKRGNDDAQECVFAWSPRIHRCLLTANEVKADFTLPDPPSLSFSYDFRDTRTLSFLRKNIL